MPPAPPVFRSTVPLAALPFVLGASLCIGFFGDGTALAQQDVPQQAPAPIVRTRPRPAPSTPGEAPQDAAPLVARPPRPRPVNPQGLSGVTAPSGQAGATGITARPRTTTSTAAATPNSSAGSSASSASERPVAAPKLSTTLNRTIVVLDPAHGGTDSGSRIGDSTLEKNVTLAFAFKLRSLLTARGFTVVLTRESDNAFQPNTANTPLTLDDRAGIANHMRPAACLLLHATGRGNGVHLYSSALEPAYGEPAVQPWLTAQASWVPASQQLEHSISSALGRSHIAMLSSTASVRPVDSLTCPALVLELAPESGDVQTINDAGYQERVAEAIAGALIFWQNQVQTPPKLTLSPSTHSATHHHAATPKPAAQEPQP